jgi:hypothetical protein
MSIYLRRGTKLMMVEGNLPSGRLSGAAGRGWLRGMTFGAALCASVAIAGDWTSAATPVEALIPAFTPADGDRSTIETTHEQDGRLKVVIRGDIYDGRRLLKAVFAGLSANAPAAFDVNLDIKVAKLAGFNGEVLHDVALRFSGRGGAILEFGLTAKLATDADVIGDLRTGHADRQTIHLEASNAGGLLRFLDIYPRVQQGRLSMTMEVPTADHAAQNGTLDVRDFAIVGEPALRPVLKLSQAGLSPTTPLPTVPVADTPTTEPLELSHLRIAFQTLPGHILVGDAVVIGPTIGATTTGEIDLASNDIKLTGTVVRPSAADSRLAVFAFNYKIAGSLQAPVLQINPLSALAPGILRKLSAPIPDGK